MTISGQEVGRQILSKRDAASETKKSRIIGSFIGFIGGLVEKIHLLFQVLRLLL